MIKWLSCFQILVASLLIQITLFGCSSGGGSSDPPNQAPTAQFTVTPDIGSFPLTVSFDASASTDPDGTITQYQWDFGDGESGSGMSSEHIYQTAGQFTATLTITDNGGLTDSETGTIDVKPQYTLSGSVTAANNLAMDSDVNDYNAAYASNDSFADAQPIPVPVTVSGYVNIASAGENGRSTQNGDTDDYYQASLASGMTITLYMSENLENSNLNLYLYNANQILIDSSIGAQ